MHIERGHEKMADVVASGLQLDAVVVGNIGVDTNVYLPQGYAPDGSEGAFTDNRDCIGQAGGYSAFGYAALGVKTGFIGYVGLLAYSKAAPTMKRCRGAKWRPDMHVRFAARST